MKTLNTPVIGFKVKILVEQITNCPHWIGDEDGLLLNYELPRPLIEIRPLDQLMKLGFSLDMTEEEKCEWLTDILSHQEIYACIADEYGEDVTDFYGEESCMDFSVSSVEMKIWRSV